jgi:polysaccharide deacetylase 2 family uncharacterized protein YibQ
MGLSVAGMVFSFSGCDKAKSTLESAMRGHRGTKERAPAQPSHSQVSGNPRLAIILDDLGSDPAAVDAVFALHYPLTLSVLPNHPHSTEIAQEAHRRGYQVMLHLPMESVGSEAPEPQQLRTGMSSSQISQSLNEMLGAVPNAIGVNNHQGSLATSDPSLMAELMPILREHHLFFVDSRTTAATVAYDTAERDGVRSAFRNVPFLDDVQEEAAIRHQLELAMRGAKEKGEAIAIGHPHPGTLRVLNEMLPQMQAQGIRLVHASDLVH